MLIVYKSRAVVEDLKASLSVEFEMKNLGLATRILGWRSSETETVACLCEIFCDHRPIMEFAVKVGSSGIRIYRKDIKEETRLRDDLMDRKLLMF